MIVIWLIILLTLGVASGTVSCCDAVTLLAKIWIVVVVLSGAIESLVDVLESPVKVNYFKIFYAYLNYLLSLSTETSLN